MSEGRMNNKVAVVSGAASGIGKAIAEAFIAEGATVIGGDVKEEHVSYSLHLLDVRDEESWRALITEAESQGGLDVLVNVAGTSGYEAVHELAPSEWERIISVNQTGTFLGMKYGIDSMLRHGRGGSVLNISSIFSTRAVSGLAAYHSSKAAVIGLTRNAAVTYAGQGVRVNAIQPGWIDTPMTASQDKDMNQSFIDSTPMARGGVPKDIADGAVYLSSEEANFVTGVVIPIDGGYLAR